jgi:hypothetical protein
MKQVSADWKQVCYNTCKVCTHVCIPGYILNSNDSGVGLLSEAVDWERGCDKYD